MSDRLDGTARLARLLLAATAVISAGVLIDALAGQIWRDDARAETAAALGTHRLGWLPPGQHPADAPPAVPLGFTPGADGALPPTRRLLTP